MNESFPGKINPVYAPDNQAEFLDYLYYIDGDYLFNVDSMVVGNPKLVPGGIDVLGSRIAGSDGIVVYMKIQIFDISSGELLLNFRSHGVKQQTMASSKAQINGAIKDCFRNTIAFLKEIEPPAK